MRERQLTLTDRLLGSTEKALKTLVPGSTTTQRRPAHDSPDLHDETEPAKTVFTSSKHNHVASLMRINHTGEVCAQALYQGQAATAKLPHVRQKMEDAAQEEEDHLAWCEERLQQLDDHTSRLNPLFYTASFTLGALAGLAGDKWSLGFVAETEHQVVRHLDSHLAQIPADDRQTHAILSQMREDELHHATNASEAGGAILPRSVQTLMTLMSRVMTWSTYRF